MISWSCGACVAQNAPNGGRRPRKRPGSRKRRELQQWRRPAVRAASMAAAATAAASATAWAIVGEMPLPLRRGLARMRLQATPIGRSRSSPRRTTLSTTGTRGELKPSYMTYSPTFRICRWRGCRMTQPEALLLWFIAGVQPVPLTPSLVPGSWAGRCLPSTLECMWLVTAAVMTATVSLPSPCRWCSGSTLCPCMPGRSLRRHPHCMGMQCPPSRALAMPNGSQPRVTEQLPVPVAP
mmetsp:Transcript_43357/g.137906  ORF Transcript_43357/g.137906 Transcript_43357/m.137906 type:complete len:238 (-) Transcript_43357:952-1665(-)